MPASSFTDPDGDTLTYAATLANGTPLPDWLQFDADTATFSGTPDNGDVGSINVKITATDSRLSSVSDTFTIVIANVNDGPELTGAQATFANGSEDTEYVISAADLLEGYSDADGDTLSVSGLTANHGNLVDNNNGTWTFTPNANYNGSVDLGYSVIDGQGGSISSSRSFTLTAANDAPELTGTQASLANGTEDAAYIIFAAELLQGYSDVDGDTLSVSGLTANDGSLVYNNNGTWTFTPTVNYNGSEDLSYSVVDGHGGLISSSRSFALTAANDAPTVSNPIADKSVLINAAFNYQFAATAFADVDAGDTLTYNSTLSDGSLLPSWLTFNAATRTYSGTPGASNIGTFNIKVTATDSSGVSVTDIFVLTVASGSIDGDSSNNILSGTSGSDTIYGFDGDDTLIGGLGNDVLNGGNGIDTASYEDMTAAVTVSLALTGQQNTGAAGRDTLNSIENLTGGAAGDTLTGDGQNNILDGGRGADKLDGGAQNDILLGGGGSDKLTGGAGIDRARYDTQVTLDLATASNSNGAAAGDTFFNIEIFELSSFADTFVGGKGDDIVYGNAGNDKLTGGAGLDTLYGGDGIDQFRFLKSNYDTDTVGDFISGVDGIAISRSGFGLGANFSFNNNTFVKGSAPASVARGETFLFNTTTGELSFDGDGTGNRKAVVIATFTDVHDIQLSDFALL